VESPGTFIYRAAPLRRAAVRCAALYRAAVSILTYANPAPLVLRATLNHLQIDNLSAKKLSFFAYRSTTCCRIPYFRKSTIFSRSFPFHAMNIFAAKDTYFLVSLQIDNPSALLNIFPLKPC